MMVLDLFFWFVYLNTIFLSILLIKGSGIKLSEVTIPMVLFWSAILFGHIGYPAIYYQWVPYYVNLGVTDQFLIFKMILISSVAWLQVFCGIYLCSAFIGKGRIIISPFPKNIFWGKWLLFLIISSIVFLFYLSVVPKVAIYAAVFEHFSPLELAKFRSDMTNNFSGKYWRYSLFFQTLIPFLTLVAFAACLQSKKRFQQSKAFVFFILGSMVSVIGLTMSLQKAPLAWFIILLGSVYLIVRRKEISFRLLIFGVTALLALLSVMYVVFMGQDFTWKILLNPVQRAITGQIVPFYYYLDVFPQKLEFVYGRTFPNPGGFFPWEPYRYTVEIANIVHEARKGIVASAPTAFFGELWVNFGYWGLFFLPIYVGIIVYIIHFLFCNRPLGVIGVALMVWVAFHLKLLAASGISTFFLDIPLFSVLIASCLLRYVIFDLRKRKT
jgi:hypothetical protein